MFNAVYIIFALLIIFIGYSAYRRFQLMKNYDPASESKHIIKLTDANFDKTISQGVTLVDFWAAWCMPCKMIAPTISELANEFSGIAKIAKLEVDHHKRKASEFGIRSIPTLILFKDGKIVQKFSGIKPKNVLEKAIRSQIENETKK